MEALGGRDNFEKSPIWKFYFAFFHARSVGEKGCGFYVVFMVLLPALILALLILRCILRCICRCICGSGAKKEKKD